MTGAFVPRFGAIVTLTALCVYPAVVEMEVLELIIFDDEVLAVEGEGEGEVTLLPVATGSLALEVVELGKLALEFDVSLGASLVLETIVSLDVEDVDVDADAAAGRMTVGPSSGGR